MIDKGMLYRTNFSVGGRDGPASGKSGNTGGGGDPRDKGMGMAGKTGNYSSGPTGNNGGGNKFSGLTKNVLNPNVDFVGNTVFGPTQKYSGDGFFSGYRNLDPVTGQPLMGLAYLGDRIKSFASRLNPLSLIGGLVAGPIGSFIGRGISSLGALRDYDTLADYAKGEFGLFQDEDEDEVDTIDIRDKYNRLGIMNPNIRPTQIFNFDPTQFNTRNRNLGELVAEVTQKDINASKARGFNMMDYGTAIDLGIISPNVSEYEFEQLKQGNITEPGTYIG
jgi:hypothetical protein